MEKIKEKESTQELKTYSVQVVYTISVNAREYSEAIKQGIAKSRMVDPQFVSLHAETLSLNIDMTLNEDLATKEVDWSDLQKKRKTGE